MLRSLLLAISITSFILFVVRREAGNSKQRKFDTGSLKIVVPKLKAYKISMFFYVNGCKDFVEVKIGGMALDLRPNISSIFEFTWLQLLSCKAGNSNYHDA